MTARLAGRKAIVTGGAAGIGQATALLFAQEQAQVIIADLNRAAGEAAAAQIRDAGGQAWFVQADVSDAGQVKALLAAAASHMGAIDILVNNAGRQLCGRLTEFPDADWEALMAVNVRSCFLMAKYGVPYLRQRQGAAIVNVGSTAGLRGGAGGVAYAASKGAIIAFSRALALEVSGDGIRVNCICPGWIDTPFNQPIIGFMGGRERQAEAVAQGVPMRRQGAPDEIATGILFLASAEAAYMTGQNLVIDGGAI